ncbi:UNVERIFIED_CONTAM: hypothetical protein K2H54_062298, partial [Gekko kuhli]
DVLQLLCIEQPARKKKEEDWSRGAGEREVEQHQRELQSDMENPGCRGALLVHPDALLLALPILRAEGLLPRPLRILLVFSSAGKNWPVKMAAAMWSLSRPALRPTA